MDGSRVDVGAENRYERSQEQSQVASEFGVLLEHMSDRFL